MAYRIIWKSTSTWVNTQQTTYEGDELYATLAEAEEAMKEMEKDSSLMEDVQAAAVESQGVEGWLEIEEDD